MERFNSPLLKRQEWTEWCHDVK